MSKKTLLLSLSMLLAIGASAAPLTPEQALQRARQEGPARVKAKATAGLKPIYSAKAKDGTVGAYIFNNPGQGYMILGADDVAYPVLGYSDDGSIDVNNMSPELKWWLDEYARQIEWAVANGAKPAMLSPQANVKAEWTAISPLLSTKWDQGAPYNDLCPTPRGETTKTYTGCVATAMAQVMNYHKYPEIGEGTIHYNCSDINRNLTLNLSLKSFDWDNMIDDYSNGNYTEAQADAVAYLMKACGYSVHMNYGLYGSGASGSDIAPALIQYFKYDPNTISHRRMTFSGSQWAEMCYNNLKECGPVILNGQAPAEGGHSFVCDGYDGKGYFHINWGWSGLSNGYFALDALNPDVQGIGSFEGGYNFSQNGIFGIRPATGEPAKVYPGGILQYGTTEATLQDRNLLFGVTNYNPLGWGSLYDHEITVNFGAMVEPIDGTTGDIRYVAGTFGGRESVSLASIYSYFPAANGNKPTITLPSLPDGKYRATLINRSTSGENQEWVPVAVPWGYRNCCILDVQNGNVTVSNLALQEIKVSDLSLISPLYSAKNAYIKAHFANNSDVELVQGVCPGLKDAQGKRLYIGSSILMSLQPGESIDYEWPSKFINVSTGGNATVSKDTEFTLVLYNPETGLEYPNISEKVVMKPNPGAPTFRLNKFVIENAETEPMEVNGQKYSSVYKVNDAKSIPVYINYQISKGYLDGAVTVMISKQDPSDPSKKVTVVDDLYSDHPFLAAGESKEISLDVDFSQAQPGTLYFFVGQYTSGNNVKTFGNLSFMISSTGIYEITDIDPDQPVEMYNLQGQKLTEPRKGEIVIMRQGDKAWKVIW